MPAADNEVITTPGPPPSPRGVNSWQVMYLPTRRFPITGIEAGRNGTAPNHMEGIEVANKEAPRHRSGARQRIDPRTYICNVVPSVRVERDWQFADYLASEAGKASGALPDAVDLRAPWWTINDQEHTGSCVGWAAADGVARHHLVKAGRLARNERLSTRYVWMASKETDTILARPESFIEQAGTTLKAAVDVARKYGLALEADLPFHIATTMYGGSENGFYASCARRRITSYFNLGKNQAEWKSWLASNGPILAALSVDASWDRATDTGGMIDAFHPETVRGGHAVCIVGYRADGRFIVRNSWGKAWGDNGFAYLAPAYVAAAFFDESYGVTV